MKAIFNENSKTPCFELVRYEDNYGWLYGRIFAGDEFICDTVEVSGLEICGNETYIISNDFEAYNANPPICLVDSLGVAICDFVHQNTIVYKNIEMRIASHDICVGVRLHYANLVSREFSLQKLKRFYRALSATESNVFFKITDKYEKCVVKHNLK